MDHVVYLLIKRCKTCEETSSSGLTMDHVAYSLLIKRCMTCDVAIIS